MNLFKNGCQDEMNNCNGSCDCCCLIWMLLLLCCCCGNRGNCFGGGFCGGNCSCLIWILLLCCCCGNQGHRNYDNDEPGGCY